MSSKDPGCYKMVGSMISLACNLCIISPLDYMFEAYLESLGILGVLPWIVNRLCPQCNPIAELMHKIYS